jgi:hypothetical protein
MLSPTLEPPAELLAEIGARLAGVCKGYTPSEFAALVHEIASVRTKYDVLRTQAFFAAARELAAETASIPDVSGTPPPRAD